MPRSTPLVIRLGRYIDTATDTGCWQWTGKVNRNGYGVIRTGGRDSPWQVAHRAAWIELGGYTIEPDCELHHDCRNRLCVNPAHMVALTSEEHHELHNAEPRPLSMEEQVRWSSPEEREAYFNGLEPF